MLGINELGYDFTKTSKKYKEFKKLEAEQNALIKNKEVLAQKTAAANKAVEEAEANIAKAEQVKGKYDQAVQKSNDLKAEMESIQSQIDDLKKGISKEEAESIQTKLNELNQQ